MGYTRVIYNMPATDYVLMLQWDEEVSPTTIYLAMEKLVEKGLAKNIGLSNFNSVQIQDVLDKAKVNNWGDNFALYS